VTNFVVIQAKLFEVSISRKSVNRKMRISPKNILSKLAIAAIVYLLLSIPDPKPIIHEDEGIELRATMLNEWWSLFEKDFTEFKAIPKDSLLGRTDLELAELKVQLALIKLESNSPNSPQLKEIQNSIFKLSPKIALLPERLNDYKYLVTDWKQFVKGQSWFWNMTSSDARTAIYYYLNGSRDALTQAILQSESLNSELIYSYPAESSDSEIKFHGIALKSGDFIVWNRQNSWPILSVSKDLPGSYDALSVVHISDHAEPKVISIEPDRGLRVIPLDEFEEFAMSSAIVLRLRADLPELIANPGLPHEAASRALAITLNTVPYDFAMDASNEEQLYPTELLAIIYRNNNISPGIQISNISSLRHREWLNRFGVSNYHFIEPYELEYDPKIKLIGEWADFDELMQEQIEFAATYAALESMENYSVSENLISLPGSRLLKVYSSTLNILGFEGPIPAGMSAQSALAFKHFEANYDSIVSLLSVKVASFEQEYKYKPTFLRLIQLASINVTK
jgi:hypothetical protein